MSELVLAVILLIVGAFIFLAVTDWFGPYVQKWNPLALNNKTG